VISGTPFLSGKFDFTVQVTALSQTASKSFSINIPLAVTTTSLPNGQVNTVYSQVLTSTPTIGNPVSWSVTAGALPAGLTLSASGTISGTPSTVGTFNFIITATDNETVPLSATKALSITILPLLSITTAVLPNAIVNGAYSVQLQAGGAGPFTWILTAGTLPAGLTLSPAGLLAGTPTATGSQTFTVTVSDTRSLVSRDFTLVVDPPVPPLSAPSLPSTLGTRQLSNLTVTLASPYPSTLTGHLNLAFTSSAEVPSDDPAVQFSTGTRSVNFTIPANITTVVFGSQITLLTGTIAGTVQLTASIDNGPNLAVASVTIPATPPQMTDITATRTGGGLDVQITGFAPARRVSTVDFSFDVKVGNRTQKVTLSRNVDADFANWYRNGASTPFGSSFSFLQSFTISSGDASVIQGVTVRLTNAQGSTTSATVVPK
jgi:hypothetical protein